MGYDGHMPQPLDLDLELASPAATTPPEGALTFIGTATTLLRYAGFTVLTDPNFLHRGGLLHVGDGIITRRLTQPALTIEQLPPVDVVVLSHLHGDHWDRVARRGLPKSLPVLTTRHAARALRRQGFQQAVAMNTWQTQVVRRGGATLSVTSLPGLHGRGVARLITPPVMGSLLDFEPASGPRLRAYITGDTLVHDALREIPARQPEIDVGIVHLGGTRVLGMLLTMDAKEGIELLDIVRPRRAVPIHYDDYRIFRSPLSDFRTAVAERGLADRITFVDRGQTVPLLPGN